MRTALLCALVCCSCAGDPSSPVATDASDVARLVDVSARTDAPELDAPETTDTARLVDVSARTDALELDAPETTDTARLVDVSARTDALEFDASDVAAELATVDAADVAAEPAPTDAPALMCARGFEFDRCTNVGELTPCCAVDSRTTVPLGCGCLVAPFRCVARGQSGCP